MAINSVRFRSVGKHNLLKRVTRLECFDPEGHHQQVEVPQKVLPLYRAWTSCRSTSGHMTSTWAKMFKMNYFLQQIVLTNTPESNRIVTSSSRISAIRNPYSMISLGDICC